MSKTRVPKFSTMSMMSTWSKMRTLRAVAGGILSLSFACMSASGYAISRVGNRTLQDNLSEAQLEIASAFVGVSDLSGNRVRLQGLGLRAIVSEVRDFSSEYPEWKHLSREAFNETLLKLEWDRVEGLELSSECVEVFAAEAQNTLTYVATWGDGSGFVFISPSTAQNKRALVETLESLQLTGSTCRWTLPASP